MADTPVNGAKVADQIDVEMKDEPVETMPSIPGAVNSSMPTTTSEVASTTSPAIANPISMPAIPSQAIKSDMPPAGAPSATSATISPNATTRNGQATGNMLPPEKPAAHGSSTRLYLNQNLTPHLLEGMKYLAAHEPEKPLKWLSDFLARKSTELEEVQ